MFQLIEEWPQCSLHCTSTDHIAILGNSLAISVMFQCQRDSHDASCFPFYYVLISVLISTTVVLNGVEGFLTEHLPPVQDSDFKLQDSRWGWRTSELYLMCSECTSTRDTILELKSRSEVGGRRSRVEREFRPLSTVLRR